MRFIFFSDLKVIRLTAVLAVFSLLLTPQTYAYFESRQETSAATPNQKNVSSLFEKSFLETALAPAKGESKNFLEFNPRLYYFTRHHVPAVKIFRSNGFYESFELNENGELSRRVETGFFENGRFTRTRLYDYDTMRIAVSNPKNLFEKRIYELKEDGKTGRPLEYRGRSANGELLNVRFQYDAEKHTVTCVNTRNMRYAVYAMKSLHKIGQLIEVGTASTIGKKNLQVRSSIKMTVLEQGNDRIPVYVFTEQSALTTVTIRERKIEEGNELGVVGRVLYYSGPEGDFEYRYEEGLLYPQPAVIITNHLTGMVLKFKIPQTVLNEEHGRMDAAKKKGDLGPAKALQNNSKYMKVAEPGAFIHGKQGGLVFHFEPQLKSLKVWRGFLRGPPSFGLNSFDSVSNPQFYSSFHFSPSFPTYGTLNGGGLC